MFGKELHKKEDRKMKNIINFFTSTFLTTVVYYLGGIDTALKTLLILIQIIIQLFLIMTDFVILVQNIKII